MTNFTRIIFIFFLCLLGLDISAQTGIVSGYIIDQETNKGLNGVVFKLNETKSAITNAEGFFRIQDIPYGRYVITIVNKEYLDREYTFVLDQPVLDLQNISLFPRVISDFPVITIEEEELENDQASVNAGLLTASQDIFVRQAGRNFSAAFFTLRGYGSENVPMYMNGANVNELSDGEASWSIWSGLNDVTRNQYAVDGLTPANFSFGGIGGATKIDSRAGSQRAGTRLGYAISNRTYQHRIMLTHNTGFSDKGWAFSLSGSRRWGNEGYVDATFYDGYAYFASLEKKINKYNRIALTGLGSPIVRGQAGPATQESYDLAGSHYYNPYWGYQNGEKRNSRAVNNHIPLVILTHEWEKKDFIITSAISYQFGRSGRQSLDWFDAADPRPDYYRYLPSYYNNTDTLASAAITSYFQANPNAMQIDWDGLYEANRNNTTTIENANGVEGNNITGRKASYVLNESHADPKIIGANLTIEKYINAHFNLHAGLSHQMQKTSNYFKLIDLLGADYLLDINKFADLTYPGVDSVTYTNLVTPNRVVYEGDRYGNDFDLVDNKTEAWAQGIFTFGKIDFFLAGQMAYKTFYRDGKFQNGLFPDNSFGKSEVQKFVNYATKGGLAYKLNGRNFIIARAAYTNRAPYSQNAFLSPRTRNQIIPNLVNEKITSFEAGYLLKAPNVKGRLLFYHTDINDQAKNRNVFLDLQNVFGNVVMNNIDERHRGIEAAMELKIIPGFFVNGVASIGDYYYTSRPNMIQMQDNSAEVISETTVYQKNYYVPGSPQRVYSAGLRYEGKKFWFINLTGSYYDGLYSDFSPLRRTSSAIDNVAEGSDLWNRILMQEENDPQFMLDVFGGKSFRIKNVVKSKPLYININIGVSNILDNQNLVSTQFEQLRYDIENKDPDKFPAKKYYSIGRNYFINVIFRY